MAVYTKWKQVFKSLVTHKGKVALDDDVTLGDGKNIVLKTTTGSKIGTATGQKLGFFNATPVTQQNVPTTTPDVADIITALVNLGLVEQSD